MDGTCFSFYSCYSFNFFPIAACLASKPYLPFAAYTGLVDWLLPFWISLNSISLYKTVQETAQRCLRAN